MLLTRILTALIGGPIVLYLVYKGSGYTLFLTMLLTFFALRELFAMSSGLGVKAWKLSGSIAGLIFCIGAYHEAGRFLPVLVILWMIYCLVRFAWQYPRVQVHDLGFNFIAVCYISLLFCHLILLRQLNQGIYLTFLALSLTWATDTGAFFVGKALGRNKLAPLISPNKTVEGAVGGVLVAAAVALVLGSIFPNQSLNLAGLAAMGMAVGITGQAGDLVESALKRMAGIKDSGKLLPGHGGFLDRFDSILFTVPTVYYIFLGLIIS